MVVVKLGDRCVRGNIYIKKMLTVFLWATMNGTVKT